MIVVTGALGFIGSCLIGHLVRQFPHLDIIAVDDFRIEKKIPNLKDKKVLQQVQREEFIQYFKENHEVVSAVFHLGARTDTLGTDPHIFQQLNLDFSKDLWRICTQVQIPFFYASSAATYGAADRWSDDHSLLQGLNPLNLYARSKHDFDLWAIEQELFPSALVWIQIF